MGEIARADAAAGGGGAQRGAFDRRVGGAFTVARRAECHVRAGWERAVVIRSNTAQTYAPLRRSQIRSRPVNVRSHTHPQSALCICRLDSATNIYYSLFKMSAGATRKAARDAVAGGRVDGRGKSRPSLAVEQRGRNRRAKPGTQLRLALPKPKQGWGGKRRNAGRKPAGARAGTPHRARPKHYHGHPVHVTLRAGLGSLRSQFLFPTVRYAITRAGRRDPARFRIVHFSVQYDHVHLIVEAADKRALGAGMRSLAIRVALGVNELLMRKGRFWADRWHGRVLTSPSDLRATAVYVLANFRKHARRPLPEGLDPCSSAAWFAHFRGFNPARDRPRYAGRPPPLGAADLGVPVSKPRTWLLTAGLGRTPRLSLDEAPRPKP